MLLPLPAAAAAPACCHSCYRSCYRSCVLTLVHSGDEAAVDQMHEGCRRGTLLCELASMICGQVILILTSTAPAAALLPRVIRPHSAPPTDLLNDLRLGTYKVPPPPPAACVCGFLK